MFRRNYFFHLFISLIFFSLIFCFTYLFVSLIFLFHLSFYFTYLFISLIFFSFIFCFTYLFVSLIFLFLLSFCFTYLFISLIFLFPYLFVSLSFCFLIFFIIRFVMLYFALSCFVIGSIRINENQNNASNFRKKRVFLINHRHFIQLSNFNDKNQPFISLIRWLYCNLNMKKSDSVVILHLLNPTNLFVVLSLRISLQELNLSYYLTDLINIISANSL